MGKKLDQKTVIERFIKKHGDAYDYSLVIYNGMHRKVKIKCKKCNKIFETTAMCHMGGSKCRFCFYKGLKQNQPLSHKSWVSKASKYHKDKYIYLTEYIGGRHNIKIQCKTCGFISNKHARIHYPMGSGCRQCQYLNLPQNNPKLTIRQFEDKCKEIHKDKYLYFGDYTGQNHKIKVQCKKCNSIFFQFAYAHYNKKQGCGKCIVSKGETEIMSFLDSKNIKYIREHKIDGMKYKQPLRLDFYLPDYNIAIEYDGILHTKSTNYFGGDNHLLLTQQRDKIKNDFCKKHKISLIRISYKERHNIPTILNHFLIPIIRV